MLQSYMPVNQGLGHGDLLLLIVITMLDLSLKEKIEDYLSISDKRDVIEYPVNDVLDISGWDIRKALQLFIKSNAPLYEWLQSPIRYTESSRFQKELLSLMEKYFSLRAGLHHYLSMAKNTYETDLFV